MNTHKCRKFYFTFLLLFAQSTFLSLDSFAAEPAFEAYSKFILGGQHSGYIVERLEIDTDKKQITSIYYTYVKTPTTSTTESLVEKADMNFEPISYQYSALVNGKTKTVDATFKNKKMTAKMTNGKRSQTVKLDVPPNGFLSYYLNYVMLKNGLTPGRAYEYIALAEESPACFKDDLSCVPSDTGFIKGRAVIKSEVKIKNVTAYEVENKYKNIPFVSYVSATGESLGSKSPLQDASTEIVATREEAVANFSFNKKHIKQLFGNIPFGVKNALHVTRETPKTSAAPTQLPAKEADTATKDQ